MNPDLATSLGGALGVITKATLLVALAGLVATVLRRPSAATRHLVWLFALGGTVAVAALAPLAPSVRVPVPASVLSAAWLQPNATSSRTTRIIGWNGPTSIVSVTASGSNTRAGRGELSRLDRAMDAASSRSRFLRTGVSASTVLAVIWLLGAVAVLARCILAHAAVARIVASAVPIGTRGWQPHVTDAAARTGVRRRVAVTISDSVGGPITSGLVHPVIVLPSDAESWTFERREAVLLHEMAHVARLDYAAQLVATAACAVYWFNPVVWIASSRMRLEAEHAADDCVLTSGLPGVRYASHLVELARRAAIGEPAAVTVGIAHRRTHIERRVHAMLDTSRSRHDVSWRRLCAAAALTLAVLVPFAGLRTEATAAEHDTTVAAATTMTPTFAPKPVRVMEPIVVQTRIPATTRTTQQRFDSTFERTLDAAAGGRIVLDLDTGGEVVVHGWGEARARVRVRLGGTEWRDTRVEFDRVSGGLRLRSTFDAVRGTMQTRHEFEIWVPRQTDVEVRSSGGSLTIEHLEGRISGHTGGGEIGIHDTKGRSSLSTGGGDVMVTDSDLSGTVSTGGGSVVLSKVSGGLRGSSGSGPVVYGEGSRVQGARGGSDDRYATADLSGVTVTSNRITTADGRGDVTTTTNDTRNRSANRNITSGNTLGRLHISKAGGAITLDAAPEGGTIHTGGGTVTIGSIGGESTISTGGGDIEIRRVTGSATISTGAGDLRITVVDDDGDEHVIEATSGYGAIELVLPRSLDARIELETAYTDGYGRRSRIESDWSLSRSETAEWESPNGGTPRKYVRATGVLGAGRGLIRVSTVNGDVVVRRAPR